jgi:hypothetical protein
VVLWASSSYDVCVVVLRMMCVPKRHIGVVYDVCVVVLCMMCVPKRHIGVVYDVCAEETHRCCE